MSGDRQVVWNVNKVKAAPGADHVQGLLQHQRKIIAHNRSQKKSLDLFLN